VDTYPARSAILGRIRAAIRDVRETESPEDVAVARDYRTDARSPRGELVQDFIERATEYKARVRRVREAELPAAIDEACRAKGVKRLVVPADLPAGWLPDGLTVLRDPGLTVDQLDTSDGVLSTCTLAVAQTGTVVLDGGPGQGRRALTLVPDYHLCVVRDDQIVGLIPEMISRLSDTMRAPGRPVTLVSGPSATSDIELNRVEGVHGPRTLELIVVETEPGDG
jgi:L-lactate dehydrogenase complex protein LldG